ncbi:unnamed protein product [Sphagnum jensenii]|uniref:Uncharacterized protein n=1 Tax=Sphagnum jensenii TaxID=128206 RepID=A0ABP1BD08_9BRYO
MRAARRVEKLLREFQGISGSPQTPRSLTLSSPSKDPVPLSGNNNGTSALRDEVARLSQLLAEERRLVASLEAEIVELVHGRKLQGNPYSTYVHKLEVEIAQWKQQAEKNEEEAEDAVWKDLHRSTQALFSQDSTSAQSLYDELQAVPENQRRARDQILVLIHEKVQKYHKEIETFTKEQDGFRLCRAALTQANEEVHRLTTELKQLPLEFAPMKQELVEEIQELSNELQELSSDRKGLIGEVEGLTDELRRVTEAAAMEKQELRKEVLRLSNQLSAVEEESEKKLALTQRNQSCATARAAEKQTLEGEVTRLNAEKQTLTEEMQCRTNELRQLSAAYTADHQDSREQMYRLNYELQQISAAAASEKHALFEEVQKLSNDFQQLSAAAASDKQEKDQEIQRLTYELQQLSKSAVHEKQELQNQLQNLTNEFRLVVTTLEAEKQEMNIKLQQLTQVSTAAALEKYEMREQVERLISNRLSERAATFDKRDLIQTVQQLISELQHVTTISAAAGGVPANEFKPVPVTEASEKQDVQWKIGDPAQDAIIQLSILTKQSGLYEELKARLDRLEQTAADVDSEKESMAATMLELIDEKQQLLEVISQRDHSLELLSKVQKLEMNQQQLQQKETGRELCWTREELYPQIFTAAQDSQKSSRAQCLQFEILRLNSRTKQEIEYIKREATEAANEERPLPRSWSIFVPLS